MAKPITHSSLLCLLLFLSTAHAAVIHDVLVSHGLPPGLLPKGIKSFFLDETTGLLEVFLDGPCLVKYDNLVHFDRVVTGNISSHGEFKGVEGLSQEELFLWFPIKKFVVGEPYEGMVLIDIGMAQKQVSISLFEEPPDCQPSDDGLGFPEKSANNSLNYYPTEGVNVKAGRKEKGFADQR
ncbi:hypothetical protein QJS04_geneDACA003250 [Acorus gramineus]|uniref:Uncharacterized protein n=1 Tax=Acorus gramineus TaxID=55184 RepID=A0AAV9BU02_ACOGR|nr:hypothetical protein QJS04_geneDACA003250 [Acorus gramineus]